MDKHEETLVQVVTKLEILIKDFQRFRDKQEERWEEQRQHVLDEEKSFSTLKGQLNWHAVIGSFAITILAYHIAKGVV